METLRVPLPAGDGPDADIRARVWELLQLTRLRVPDGPLTSLEEQAGHGPRPPGHG